MTVGTRRLRSADNARDDVLIRTLYAEHGRSLLAYATRLVGDRAAAEDLVQETLIKAWTHADSLAELGSVRGWLLKVLRNIAVDRFRAKASRPVEVDEQPGAPPIERDHAEAVVDAVTVLKALDTLPAHQRDVLVEVYYRGRTAQETSQSLGIPEGTVRSRVFYALRSMRTVVADRGEVAGVIA